MGVPAVRLPSRHNFRIIDTLNAEWAQLSLNTDYVGRLAGQYPALCGCRDLGDVLSAARVDSDAVLGALLCENANGIRLAGRTVLQTMLGRIVLLALRDTQSSVDDYVAAAWCRISTYPLGRRPVRIAANLALDTLKSVKQEKQWGKRPMQVTTLPDGTQLEDAHSAAQIRGNLDHNADVASLSATRVISAAGRLGLINGEARAVLLSVYSDGLSGRAAAQRHETSPDMIRYRCSKAVRRLAQHATLLAEAA